MTNYDKLSHEKLIYLARWSLKSLEKELEEMINWEGSDAVKRFVSNVHSIANLNYLPGGVEENI